MNAIGIDWCLSLARKKQRRCWYRKECGVCNKEMNIYIQTHQSQYDSKKKNLNHLFLLTYI